MNINKLLSYKTTISDSLEALVKESVNDVSLDSCVARAVLEEDLEQLLAETEALLAEQGERPSEKYFADYLDRLTTVLDEAGALLRSPAKKTPSVNS